MSMIIKCLMKEIPDEILNSNLAGRCIAKSLVGGFSSMNDIEEKCILTLVRLTTKAKEEYVRAREAMIEEEKETGMTFVELEKRGEGRYIYTYPIINHLENCITTVQRIYSIFYTHFSGININNGIKELRNSIEHIEFRIRESKDEYPSIDVSEDAMELQVAGSKKGEVVSVSTNEITESIIFFNKMLLDILENKNTKVHYKGK